MSTFDENYFNNLMDKAAKEGADPTIMDDARKAFANVPKPDLKALFESDPSKFYKNYANIVCSAAMDRRTNASALSSFLSKARMHEGKENDPHGFFYNGMRYVAATLLGLVKFAWDVVLISSAFTARFAGRLVSNVANAIVITCKETAVDGKYAFAEIKGSFSRNIMGKEQSQTVQETTTTSTPVADQIVISCSPA